MSKNVGGKRQRSRVQGGWSNPPSSIQKKSPRNPFEDTINRSKHEQKPSVDKDVVPSSCYPQQQCPEERSISDEQSIERHSKQPGFSDSHDGSASISVKGTGIPQYLFQDIPRATVQPKASGTLWKPVMPKNFSWVVNEKVCAMAFPSEPGNLQYLLDMNVRYLISLTAERQPDVQHFPELTLININVDDFTPPTLEQIEQCLDIIERANKEGNAVGIHCRLGKGRTGVIVACVHVKMGRLGAYDAIAKTKRERKGSLPDGTLELQNAAVGIHCAHGKGRTGAVLACYFVKHNDLSSSEAIQQIRLYRPQSVETKEQEERVRHFEEALLNGSIQPEESTQHCLRKQQLDSSKSGEKDSGVTDESNGVKSKFNDCHEFDEKEVAKSPGIKNDD